MVQISRPTHGWPGKDLRQSSARPGSVSSGSFLFPTAGSQSLRERQRNDGPHQNSQVGPQNSSASPLRRGVPVPANPTLCTVPSHCMPPPHERSIHGGHVHVHPPVQSLERFSARDCSRQSGAVAIVSSSKQAADSPTRIQNTLDSSPPTD